MKGRNHELISVSVLFMTSLILFKHHFYYLLIGQFIAGWVLQTFYINCDLDARFSRSKNRIGFFKYLFTFTKHRGTLHSPWFWISFGEFFWIIGYPWFGAGLVGSSVVHLVLDKISDCRNIFKLSNIKKFIYSCLHV